MQDATLTLEGTAEEEWLARFHEGRRATMEEVYREYFATVKRAIGTIVTGADGETVIHELFYRLLARAELRRSFRGGSLAAWLSTVARNQALDFRRRYRNEQVLGADDQAGSHEVGPGIEARLLVAAFEKECLPSAWAPVFRARFVMQLSQREAAAELGLSRTTLAYQELRIRSLLRKFLTRRKRS